MEHTRLSMRSERASIHAIGLVPVVGVLLLLLALPVGAKIVAEARGEAVGTDFVKLTLVVPRTTYPRNALVRVTMRVKNVSHADVELEASPATPRILVVDDSGRIAYSPNEFAGDGPDGRLRLRPRQVYTLSDDVVLHASHLQGSVDIVSPPAGFAASSKLNVRLTPAPAPEVHLHTSGPVVADVIPRSRVLGPLHYEETLSCASFGGSVEQGSSWITASSRQLVPQWDQSCTGHLMWHVVAGWIGHPVVEFSFHS